MTGKALRKNIITREGQKCFDKIWIDYNGGELKKKIVHDKKVLVRLNGSGFVRPPGVLNTARNVG